MKNNKGFTLIELLIVVAILAILASVAFVALDPLTRFRDSRDATRWTDVSSILNAVKVNQVDNRGSYLATIEAVGSSSPGEVFMIGTGTSGCEDNNAFCDTPVGSDTHCVDLGGLQTAGLLGEVPISPNGAGTWSASSTGYTMQYNTNGSITIRACESENTAEISAVR